MKSNVYLSLTICVWSQAVPVLPQILIWYEIIIIWSGSSAWSPCAKMLLSWITSLHISASCDGGKNINSHSQRYNSFFPPGLERFKRKMMSCVSPSTPSACSHCAYHWRWRNLCSKKNASKEVCGLWWSHAESRYQASWYRSNKVKEWFPAAWEMHRIWIKQRDKTRGLTRVRRYLLCFYITVRSHRKKSIT